MLLKNKYKWCRWLLPRIFTRILPKNGGDLVWSGPFNSCTRYVGLVEYVITTFYLFLPPFAFATSHHLHSDSTLLHLLEWLRGLYLVYVHIGRMVVDMTSEHMLNNKALWICNITLCVWTNYKDFWTVLQYSNVFFHQNLQNYQQFLLNFTRLQHIF